MSAARAPVRRLTPGARRRELLDAGAAMFAERGYDDVVMDEVAERAGASRALLYRHFPGKGELFAAVYAEAADRLLAETTVDVSLPLDQLVRAGLDAHLDYFVANRRTVIDANRTLAGDPTVAAIISDELGALRAFLLEALGATGSEREELSSVLMAWLVFVRTYSVDWLVRGASDRDQLLRTCTGALFGALDAVPDAPPK